MSDETEYTLHPMHPGEMLREEFMVPFALNPAQLAKALGVSRGRIDRIAKGQSSIDAEMALRLGKVLGTSPGFWVQLQNRYDMLVAQEAIGPALAALEALVGPPVKH